MLELQDVPEEEEVLEVSSLLHDVMKKTNTAKKIEVVKLIFIIIACFLCNRVIKKID